jgi:excisionase family DNA binding protein
LPNERLLCKLRPDTIYYRMSPPTYLTVRETAEILRCTDAYVRLLLKNGKLPKFQPAKKMVRIRLADVCKFMGNKLK